MNMPSCYSSLLSVIASIIAIPVAFSQVKESTLSGNSETVPVVAQDMIVAAENVLAMLTPEQRTRAVYPFTDDKERRYFHFFPIERNGLPLKDMNIAQQQLAYALMNTGLSHVGISKSMTIMSLGETLRITDGDNYNEHRDSDHYNVTIFGQPSTKSAWGWRFEGFHLSLSFTVVDGKQVASKPSFFGSIPATIKKGERKGLQVLRLEESLGRSLAASLNESQRKLATIPLLVFEDTTGGLSTGNTPKITPPKPDGIPASKLSAQQSAHLMRLIKGYAHRLRTPIAKEDLAEIAKASKDQLYFAWGGSLEPFQPHYYKIQGPSFLIEYECTQDDANHVHTVWRDFDNDFGVDMLKRHHAKHH